MAALAGYQKLSDPLETFEKMQELLKTKNDTSRFVGLALLKTVLDNGQLGQDPDRIQILWEALSPKFLDRLLRAQDNDKISKTEAKDLVDLAVAILHTFTNLLPESAFKEKRLTGRVAPLLKSLVRSSQESTDLILQALLTIVSHREGAIELIHIDDLSPLTEISPQYSLALDILSYAWINASTISTEISVVQASIDKIIPSLLIIFKQTDAVTLIQSVGSFFPKLDQQALSMNPKWLDPLVTILRKLVSRKPTATGRAAYTKLAATLLQAYPTQCPSLLFKDGALKAADSKPFSYLLVNLLLIDLRSSFPSLLTQINTAEYPAISQRLSAAFDVLSSFIGFLVRSLDDDEGNPSYAMPPDLLLKLRKDIAETLSLNIEYLRDRWDASIAGASGLHPSAITGTAATSEGTRLTLTWESITDNVIADPLIVAGIRALAIWIREDENENLRNESCGLMDMFVELYKRSADGTLDFRYPILLALEVIVLSDNGVEAFTEQNGWSVVAQDLQLIFAKLSEGNAPQPSVSEEVSRGLEIIRVLIAILDHPTTRFPQEDWMTAVTVVASMKTFPTSEALTLELQIAALQLSAALLSKAAVGVQKQHLITVPALLGLVNQLRIPLKKIDKTEAAELAILLDDVSLELENLRSVR